MIFPESYQIALFCFITSHLRWIIVCVFIEWKIVYPFPRSSYSQRLKWARACKLDRA